MSKFCINCGAALDDSVLFCTACNAQQPEAGTVCAQPVHPQPVYVKPKVPGRGFGITSMILGIIGVFYAVALCFSMIMLSILPNHVPAIGDAFDNFDSYYNNPWDADIDEFFDGFFDGNENPLRASHVQPASKSFKSTFSFFFALAMTISVVFLSVLSILALIFGKIAKKRGYENGISKSGIITGLCGIIIYAGCLIYLIIRMATL